jgi:hypothetical protein
MEHSEIHPETIINLEHDRVAHGTASRNYAGIVINIKSQCPREPSEDESIRIGRVDRGGVCENVLGGSVACSLEH